MEVELDDLPSSQLAVPIYIGGPDTAQRHDILLSQK